MQLGANELALLKTAVQASTDPAVMAALAQRDDTTLAGLLNVAGTVNAWNEQIDNKTLFKAMDVTLFDGLTGGKRDAWRLMLDYTPLDMRDAENRKAIVDVWGATEGPNLLGKTRRKMTLAEVMITPDIPANRVTTSGVTGVKTTWYGTVDPRDIGRMFNATAAVTG